MLEGTEESCENPHSWRQYSGRDSNPTPPKYESKRYLRPSHFVLKIGILSAHCTTRRWRLINKLTGQNCAIWMLHAHSSQHNTYWMFLLLPSCKCLLGLLFDSKRWRWDVLPKRQFALNGYHDIFQKREIFITTVLRTSGSTELA
jgi:hypothetical protein